MMLSACAMSRRACAAVVLLGLVSGPAVRLASAQDNAAETQYSRGARFAAVTYGRSRDRDIGSIQVTQWALGYYVAEGLSVQAGLNLAYADPRTQPNGVQGGPELGARWHFLRHDTWSTYVEASAATVLHEHSLTAESLRFNFDLEGGVGATRAVHSGLAVMGGLRWHHLSNARVRGEARNLGYDAPMLYGGLMRHF